LHGTKVLCKGILQFSDIAGLAISIATVFLNSMQSECNYELKELIQQIDNVTGNKKYDRELVHIIQSDKEKAIK
jgi:hypothetical protein